MQEWGLYAPDAWLSGLAGSALGQWGAQLRVLYGPMRILHLLGTVGFFGMIALFNAMVLGALPTVSLDGGRAALVRVLRGAFWLTVATGLALFLMDPVQVGHRPMVLPKVLLCLLGYALSYWPASATPGGVRPQTWKPYAIASLAIWFGVIVLSTWNLVAVKARNATLWTPEIAAVRPAPSTAR